jgi:Ni,Fe-hydrogenase III large subunit/Ni,Fe-hydrogenase III component G
MSNVIHVPADGFAPMVADLLAGGARYRMLLGTDDRVVGGDGLAVEAALGTEEGGLVRVVARLPLDDPAYPSLTPLVPAVHWDEREAADLLGLRPLGHPDPRRLVLHETFPDGFLPLRKDVPAGARPPVADGRWEAFTAEGEGIYQLPVGPIHAGVIEPGHFRFSAVGERVLHLDARLFFTHRGLEKLAEGRALAAALPLVERACGVCTVTHALAYAQAVEALTEVDVPGRARWGRVLLAELERAYNHVGDLGNMCAGMGFNAGSSRLGALKERLLRLNDALVGHRYLQAMIVPGGLRRDLAADRVTALPAELDAISHELAAAVRVVLRSDGAVSRLNRTGTVTADGVRVLGGLGVAAKAVGFEADLRRDEPYAAYGELEVAVVTAHTGDAAARFHVRAQEAHDALRLAREVAGRLPAGEWVARDDGSVPAVGAVAMGGAEGPRGTSWIWLRAGAEGTVDRVRLRTASFANWPIVASAVTGDLVPDFPLINKSFELCYACTDR